MEPSTPASAPAPASALSDRALHHHLHALQPDLVVAGLHALEQALSSASPARRAALTCLLPRDARRIPRDVQSRLLSLQLSLAGERLSPLGLRWRDADLPPHLQARWLALELAVCPERLLAEPLSERLLRALSHLRTATLPAPARLLRALSLHGAPLLAAEGLALLPRQLTQAPPALLPDEASALLVALTLRSAPHHLAGALALWSAPWFVLSGAWQPGPLLHGMALGGATARAAVSAAAALGQVTLLRRWATDPALTPSLRSHLLGVLGDLGSRDTDLPTFLATPDLDPTEALLGLRHRGIYVQADQLPVLLARVPVQGPADPDLAERLLALTAHLPEALEAALSAIPPEDGRWRTLAGVAARLPGGAVLLAGVADQTPVWSIRRAALAASRDEALLLRWAATEADVCLPPLRAVGGEACRAWLHMHLGLTDGEPVHVGLRPVYREALALLWHLTPAEARLPLLPHLDPADLPSGVTGVASAGSPLSAVEQVFLARIPGRSPSLPVVLEQLCQSGQADRVPTVLALLRNHILALTEGSEPYTEAWVPLAVTQEARPELSAGLLRALDHLGASLRLEAGEGARQVVGWLLELAAALDAQGAPAAARVALSPLIGRRVPVHAPAVRCWLRHADVQVRALAVRILADWSDLASGHDVVRLAAEAEDIETRRAALESVGAMRLAAGAGALIAALEHPNMNLKRCAARTLAVLCPLQASPRLLFWLGYHDNRGFRADLRAALEAIHGEQTQAILLSAILAAPDARTRLLLGQEVPDAHRHPRIRAAQGAPSPVTPLPAWDLAQAIEVLRAGDAAEARATAAAHPLAWLAMVETLEPPLRAEALAVLLQSGAPVQRLFAERARWLVAEQRAAGPGNPAEATLLREVLPALPLSPEGAAAAVMDLRAAPAVEGAAWLALLQRWGADIQPADLCTALQHLGRHPQAVAERKKLLCTWLPDLSPEARTALARDPDTAVLSETMRGLPLGERWAALGAEAQKALHGKRAQQRQQHPDPRPTPLSLEAYLQLPPEAEAPEKKALLALALLAVDTPAMAEQAADPRRVVALMEAVPPTARLRLVPWLLRQTALETRTGLGVLRGLPVDALVPLVADAGEARWVEALVGRGALLPAPELERIRALAPERLWARLTVRPLPDEARQALAETLGRWQQPRTPRTDGPRLPTALPLEAHLAVLRAGQDAAKVRVALRAVSRVREPEVVEVVAALLGHADGRLRSAAHRCLRTCAPQERYLEETLRLLSDPRVEVQRAAIQALAHRRYAPAARPLVRLLRAGHPGVQRAAAAGLGLLGEAALGELHQARRQARPDQRTMYEDLIETILQSRAAEDRDGDEGGG